MSASLKPKYIDCYCPDCDRETHHEVLYSVEEYPGNEDFWAKATFSIVKCMGCGKLLFHKEDLDDSMIDYDEDGNEYLRSEITTFPSKQKLVKQISSYWKLPSSVKNLYFETMECLNNGHLQLAASGFRAIIEAICRESNIKGSTLELMINNLAKAHLITSKDRDHLHAIRFMGNDSIHSIKTYKESELSIVAHIVNTVLTSLYIIADEVKYLGVKPISDYVEFVKILDASIASKNIGEIYTLRNLVKHERRIIKEDLPKFEIELQQKITEGSFTKLSLCPTPANGRAQQYKIVSVN